MDDASLCLDGKLHIIPIGPFHQPNPLDLALGEGFDAALLADQHAPANAHAISEGEMLAVRLQLPTRRFVLHRAVILLEARVALFAGFLLSTILVEAGNGEPGSV